MQTGPTEMLKRDTDSTLITSFKKYNNHDLSNSEMHLIIVHNGLRWGFEYISEVGYIELDIY